MKPIELSLCRKLAGTALAVVLAIPLAAAGCGGSLEEGSTTPLRRGKNAMSSEGSVEIEPADNGILHLVVEVQKLPPPERLSPGATVYTVWVRPVDVTALSRRPSPWHNLGTLRVDDDRSGHLETLTAFRTFDLMISPEPTPAAREPSGAAVLHSRVLD